MWTRQPERLEDVCAALFYSGVDDKRERAGLSSQSSGWLGARGNGPIVIKEDDVVWSLARGLLAEPTTRQVMAHIQFFMYQGYESRKNCKPSCSHIREWVTKKESGDEMDSGCFYLLVLITVLTSYFPIGSICQ